MGGEIQKTRPAVVLSNDNANQFLNRVTVVPLTTNTKKVYPGEAVVHVQGRSAKALANQLVTVAKEKVGDKLSVLATQDLALVEKAVKFHLGLT